MTSQTPTKTDAKPLTISQDDEAQTSVESPEVEKELTEEQIASVAGGVVYPNGSGGNFGGPDHGHTR
jgi:biopolymer transport protein ExbD